MADSCSVVRVGEFFDALVAFTDIALFDAFARNHEVAAFIRSYAEIHERVLDPTAGCVIEHLGKASPIVFPGEHEDTTMPTLLDLHQIDRARVELPMTSRRAPTTVSFSVSNCRR